MNTPALIIDGVVLRVTPDLEHEYTLPTAEVAVGYGVADKTIQNHKLNHLDELIEGKHFFVSQNMGHGNLRGTTTWTKRGIIRLGFFIKSERAKRFRDMAEDLIIDRVERPEFPHSLPSVPDMVAAKIAAYSVTSSESATVLRMLVDLHRDITEAPQPLTEPVSISPETATMAKWLIKLALMQADAGIEERRYTIPELLAQCPPIPERQLNRGAALGKRLAILAGVQVPMSAGRRAVIVPTRNGHGRAWVLQFSQEM